MIVTKTGNILTLELIDDENEVIDHLEETRGSTYIRSQLEFWLKGRTDTVREELKIELLKEDPIPTIKELRQRVKDKQN